MIVKPKDSTMNPTSDLLLDTAMRSSSPYLLNSAISISLTQISSVDCSRSPNCKSLKRGPCAKTAATCGPCLPGFVGMEGDSNSLCVSSGVTLSVGADCSLKNSVCGPLEYCSGSNICELQSKTCAIGCSGKGVCRYIDSVVGIPLSACSIGNQTCVAECACITGYYGSYCQLSTASLASMVNSTDNAITALTTLSNILVPSGPSLQQIDSIFSMLPLEPSLYSELAIEKLTNLIPIFLETTLSLNYSIDNILGVYNVIQLPTENSEQYTSRRLTGSINSDLFTTLSKIYANSMAAGQNDVLKIGNNNGLRYVYTSPAVKTSHAIVYPLTDIESYIGVNASNFVMSNLHENSKISFIFSRPSSNRTLSNVARIQIDDVSKCEHACGIEANIKYRNVFNFEAVSR